MKKVAAYVRVSSKKQNVDLQIRDLNKWAEREEWDLEIFEEKMSTRKTRPVYENMIKKVFRKEYDGLIVWKMDRLARSLKHMITTLEDLHINGIMFRSYKEPEINFESAFGRAMVGIIGTFAQLERDLIQERTIAALETKKAQGMKLGRDAKHPVQVIYDLMDQGLTNREIADQLEYNIRTIQRVRKNRAT